MTYIAKRGFSFACICALIMPALAARAQSVSFAGVQTTINTGTYVLNRPNGVAVDNAGNVFIADNGNSRVVEIPANGGSQTTVGSGLAAPRDVVADGVGDVFIADLDKDRVVKVNPFGVQTTVGSGLSTPTGVALDGAGDVFIADDGNGRVVEVPYFGGGSYGTQTTVGSGWSFPTGVALDGAGDVFISDQGLGQVVEVPYLGGGNYGTQFTVPTDDVVPATLAVDGAGDLYLGLSTDGASVAEFPYLGGGSYGAEVTIGTGLLHVWGVAVDAVGDVFITDDEANQAVEVQRVSVNFGSINLGAGANTLSLNYTINSSVTLAATPTVVTQGAPNLDFTLVTSNCNGSLATGASCVVNINFAPRGPGLREGAVRLFDSSGNLLATTLIHGNGVGPAIAFVNAAQITLPATGLSYPADVAVDGAGDVFIADEVNSRVVEIPAGGGAQTTLPLSGLSEPYGVAVDGAGDLFIADYNGGTGSGAVFKALAPAFTTQSTVGSGITNPYGVAVDGAGDVFIGESSPARVVEVSSAGYPQTSVGSGLSKPWGVAVDGAGDVFIADFGANEVVKVPPLGSQTTVASGLSDPTGVAVDGGGDVFIADTLNNRVLEVPFLGGGNPFTVGSGLIGPEGVKLDAAGDVFIADSVANQVVEVQRSQPPTVTFPQTGVGNTSSPLIVTVQSVGSTGLTPLLTFSSFTASTNFKVDAGTTTCSTSEGLAYGESCNIGVDCVPTGSGSLNGTLTITDNALNVSGATQSVPLSCTGAQSLPTTTTLTTSGSPSSGGQTVTFTATVSPAPTYDLGLASVTFKANGVTIGTVGFLTAYNGVVALNYSGLLPSGSPYNVVATYSGSPGLAASTSNTVSQTVSIEPTTTTLGASTTTPTYGQSVTLTATVSSTNGVAPAGSVTFKNGTASIGTVTLVKSGTGQAQAVLNISTLPVAANSITASYTGSTLLQASASTAATVNVSLATSTTTLAGYYSPSVYGETVNFVATVTPEYGGTPTGTMTFYENGHSIGVLPLSGGKATLPVTSLTPATYSLTATYNGSTDVAGSSTTTAWSQVVNKAATTTAVVSSSPTVTHGTPVTFTATVTATAPSTAVPPGSVVFYDTFNGTQTELGVGTLSGGKATLTHTYAAAQEGLHSVTAKYTGSAYVNASPASPAITQTVD